MKWASHIMIGVSPALVFNPVGIIPSAIGSIAPDFLEPILDYFHIPVKHRGVTHYLIFWLIGLVFSILIYDFHNILFWFFIGGINHIFCDSLTPTGVKLSPLSRNSTTLFGGRFRTGDYPESILAVSILCLSLFFGYNANFSKGDNSGYSPFWTNYQDLYNQGIITGKEWKEKRLTFF